MEDQDHLDQFVHHAKAVSRASLVVLSRFDPETLEVRPLAWAGLDSRAAFLALMAVQRVLPDFQTMGLRYRADVNPFTRSLYLEGKPVSAPVQEAAQGIVDERVLAIARRIVGAWQASSWPLKLDGQVVGALSFQSSRLFSEGRRQTCESLARDAGALLSGLSLRGIDPAG